MFAARLADHPAALYDTSCFSPYDVLELFAQVPAERIVFASDAPYGRPAGGLYQALRVASLAAQRSVDGRLLRVGAYLTMCFGALFGAREAGGAFEPARILSGVALARCVCRDPEPDSAGRALARIDSILLAAEQVAVLPAPRSLAAIGLLQGASIIAATEPVQAPVGTSGQTSSVPVPGSGAGQPIR